MEWKIKKGTPWAYGVWIGEKQINLVFEAAQRKKVKDRRQTKDVLKESENRLRVYRLSDGTSEDIRLKTEWKFGDAYAVSLVGQNPEDYGYQILQDGIPVAVPDSIGAVTVHGERVHLFKIPEFDWEDDKAPGIDFDDIYLYKLHVKGFTKQSRSNVKFRGTFSGVTEKLSYLKSLGINAIELMPVYDFVVTSEENSRDERKNYWGYGPADYRAVKPDYGVRPELAADELRSLVKAFHKEGMEVYLEILFDKAGDTEKKLACLRYWATAYHVDGFHLSAATTPMADVLSDPILSDKKIMSENFDGSCDRNPEGRRRAVYHNGFQENMRRFLRGDAGAADGFTDSVLKRSREQGYIQYMTNNNGFTLMDLVSYNSRHNAENGEHNLDGTDQNLSWNCGEEGPSRKKEVNRLRRQQLKNGWILNIFQQGTPLIYAGDEFGNSQKGNNNAWCQDNPISWLDWKLLTKNLWLFEFVRELIALRKKEKLLHPSEPFKMTDKNSNGLPDVSFHGKSPWFCEDGNRTRCMGCMYAGKNEAWYFAYNMNSVRETFALPRLPENGVWEVYLDTAEFWEKGQTAADGEIQVEDHSIVLWHGTSGK